MTAPVRKKRDSVSRNEPSVIAHFDDIMSGSTNIKVDPESCIRLTKVRGLSESGVCRLMSLYSGGSDSADGIASAGIALGSDIPIVVELTGSLRHFIHKHFKDMGLSGLDLESRVNSRQKWYGIIDGQHSHEAIMRLRSRDEKWAGFLWFVCLVRGGQSVDRYQQLARFQNARHNSSFFIESTFYDLISNLKQEYNKLKSKKTSCSGSSVVKAFIGMEVEEKRFRTLVQTANAVSRLPDAVINTIGEVCDSEYADLCLSNNSYNIKGSKTANEIMKVMDCRVFRKMLNITSLKSSRAFMNASGEKGERAQILTIYRARDVCKESMFKPVRHDIISKLFQLSVDAINEERKFLLFLSPSTWPEEMSILRSNLLRSTILDDQLESNRGEKRLLKALKDSFSRHFPAIAPQKLSKFCATIGISMTDEQQGGNVDSILESFNTNNKTTSVAVVSESPNSQLDAEDISNQDCTQNAPAAEFTTSCDIDPCLEGGVNDSEDIMSMMDQSLADEQTAELPREKTSNVHGRNSGTETPRNDERGSREDENVQKNNMKSDEQLLEDIGIKTHNIGWKLFESDFLESNSQRFDLIITEPPDAPSRSFFGVEKRQNRKVVEIDHEDVIKFPSFSKRVLKSGGYVLLFSKVDMFQEWFNSFKSAGFSCMEGMYVFCYDPQTVPRRQINAFPQHTMMTDYALLARAPGDHPKNFTPDFDSAFHQLPITGKRRSTILQNIPYVKNKLTFHNTRMPVCLTEKNVDLIHELVDLFCPIQGSVLDPFGGAFSTAVACMNSSRSCVSLEADERAYRASFNRLTMVLEVQNNQLIESRVPKKQWLSKSTQAMDCAQHDNVNTGEQSDCEEGQREDHHEVNGEDGNADQHAVAQRPFEEEEDNNSHMTDHLQQKDGGHGANGNCAPGSSAERGMPERDSRENDHGEDDTVARASVDDALLLLKMNRPQHSTKTRNNNKVHKSPSPKESRPGTRSGNLDYVAEQISARGRHRRSKRSLPSSNTSQKRSKK